MNEMLITILVLIICLGIGAGFKYLKTNNMIKKQDIDYVISAFGLTSQIAIQMNLFNEKNIVKISDIIIKSLTYCKANFDGVNIYDNTKLYVYDMCKASGMKLNDSQVSMINQLILIALNKDII
ncbi:hypothetical protein [Clostridium tagluense]|uniref:Uncharacterized protein n=1 Tax=Clostridium tagluense TaxID=360422 RepID=A0A401UQI2_9CLOT|nr:hypothetical protein [Clostridium tagluense]GCD11771.1 hypothetical protein Ctaglu_33940 [Clostridium tagluense]